MLEKLKSKRVLITGATGFIGANLTRHLIKMGIRPYLFMRKSSHCWRIKDLLDKASIELVDLTCQQEVEHSIARIRPEIIYHCAVYGGYSWQTDPEMIIKTDIDGTLNLLFACKKCGFELFVNTGTSSEYGLKNTAMKETDFLEPITVYGVSKASATLFCTCLAKREGLNIITLRLFSAYGYLEEVKRLIPWVVVSCLKNKDIRLSSAESVRDFIFIEDVVDAYMKATELAAKGVGEIFNIGSARQASVKEMVELIVQQTKTKVRPLWNSLPNPRIEPKCWLADIAKAKEQLNWSAKHSLEEGVEKTVEWFKQNIGLYDEF